MIPLRDENPTRTTPVVVYILVALNVAAFLYNGTLTRGGHNPLAGFELVPASLLGGHSFGMQPQVSPWLTVFTSMFLHANILHIAGNMLYLWIFGNNIEDALGHIKFLIFYLVAGFGAAMAQVLMNPGSHVPMVGASGAIAGVLGAYLILYPRARITCLIFLFYIVQVTQVRASVVLGFWIILQVISSALSGASTGGGVAYAAHVGGFLSGVVMIMLLGGRGLATSYRPSYDRVRRW